MNYTYDGDGRRVAKVGSKLYWYGSGGEILAETDANGDPENDYIFFGGKRVAMVPNNTNSNGGFEQGLQGWTPSGTVTAQVLTDPTKAHSGNNYLEVSTSTAGESFVISTQQIPVSIGQTLVYGGWRFREVGPSSYSRWEMTVTSVNGSATGHPPDDSVFGSWLFQTGSYTIPSWMQCPCSAVLKVEMLTSAGYLDTARFDDGFLTVGQFAETGAVYYAEDMLGTSRIVTQSNGAVCYDADFYPYGGERPYTNTCPQPYKFEGKERDTETGNDDFGARYYSNRFGRWLSSDWSAVPTPVPYATLTNPQTLNLYSMVSDDPESFADLDGHYYTGAYTGADVDNCIGKPCSVSRRADVTVVVTAPKSFWQRLKGGLRRLWGGITGGVGAAARPPARFTRGIWEKFHGRPWPRDPPTGGNMEADHDPALSEEGGDPNDPTKIFPRTHAEHIGRHQARGDFQRWGKSGSAMRSFRESLENALDELFAKPGDPMPEVPNIFRSPTGSPIGGTPTEETVPMEPVEPIEPLLH